MEDGGKSKKPMPQTRVRRLFQRRRTKCGSVVVGVQSRHAQQRRKENVVSVSSRRTERETDRKIKRGRERERQEEKAR
jgi:hypothetical protein